ncbi:MAG: guanylate kinase [Lentisphaeria bacterium]|nr:guanylate kinase [Lentisphaeria bacterium]NQZ69544.1 guanylate kinase [Lentisphaeria bacterium]
MSKGKLIIVTAPSGAGKSTIIHHVMQTHPNLHFSVSCTTRAPRKNEIDGQDYFFLNDSQFNKKVDAGEFIEHACVHENNYGTLKSELMNFIDDGKNVLLDIDVQGANQLRNILNDEMKAIATFVYIAPPSIEALEERLRARGTETEDVIQTRLANAKSELDEKDKFDIIIMNHKLSKAIEEFTAIVDAP